MATDLTSFSVSETADSLIDLTQGLTTPSFWQTADTTYNTLGGNDWIWGNVIAPSDQDAQWTEGVYIEEGFTLDTGDGNDLLAGTVWVRTSGSWTDGLVISGHVFDDEDALVTLGAGQDGVVGAVHISGPYQR